MSNWKKFKEAIPKPNSSFITRSWYDGYNYQVFDRFQENIRSNSSIGEEQTWETFFDLFENEEWCYVPK